MLKVLDEMSQRDMCKETKNKNSTKKIIRKIKLECKINYKTKENETSVGVCLHGFSWIIGGNISSWVQFIGPEHKEIDEEVVSVSVE
jgi:hypothetical protein